MLREHKHTQSIQISFSYNGVRCRESLNLQHTSANIKYAERLYDDFTPIDTQMTLKQVA